MLRSHRHDDVERIFTTCLLPIVSRRGPLAKIVAAAKDRSAAAASTLLCVSACSTMPHHGVQFRRGRVPAARINQRRLGHACSMCAQGEACWCGWCKQSECNGLVGAVSRKTLFPYGHNDLACCDPSILALDDRQTRQKDRERGRER